MPHNYLVTDVHDVSRVLQEAFYIARSGRPGPVLVDIAKDAQQASIEWEYDHTPIRLPGYRPDLRPLSKDIQQALEMIHAARRPVILAGHGVLMSGAMYELRQFAEQMRFMWKFGLASKAYYQFELFDPALAAVAGQYLQRTETKSAAYKIMHRPTGHRLSEKLDFHDRCKSLGLPVAPVVFAAGGFAAVTVNETDAGRIAHGMPITVPRSFSGGDGASRVRNLGQDGRLVAVASATEGMIRPEVVLVENIRNDA